MERFVPTQPQSGELLTATIGRLFDEIAEHYNKWLEEQEATAS